MTTSRPYLVLGLGNPGDQYTRTPHNAGASITDGLADRWQCDSWQRERIFVAVMARCSDRILMVPETYMNRVGEVLTPFLNDEDPATLTDRLIVLHDDIDQPLGSFKIVTQGGAGGHNGVRSVFDVLGTQNVTRIKIGVAPVDEHGNMRKPSKDRVQTYLLRPLPEDTRERILTMTDTVADAITCIIRENAAKAMSLYNSDQ